MNGTNFNNQYGQQPYDYNYNYGYSGYAQNPNTQPKVAKISNTLTSEDKDILGKLGGAFSIEPTREEIAKSHCSHRYDNGEPSLVNIDPQDPTRYRCNICREEFNIVSDSVEKIAETTKEFVNALETAKLAHLHAQAPFIQAYYEMIPLIKKFPQVWEIAQRDLSSTSNAYNSTFDTNNPRYGGFGMLNAVTNGYGYGYGPQQGYGYAPQYPQYNQQPYGYGPQQGYGYQPQPPQPQAPMAPQGQMTVTDQNGNVFYVDPNMLQPQQGYGYQPQPNPVNMPGYDPNSPFRGQSAQQGPAYQPQPQAPMAPQVAQPQGNLDMSGTLNAAVNAANNAAPASAVQPSSVTKTTDGSGVTTMTTKFTL